MKRLSTILAPLEAVLAIVIFALPATAQAGTLIVTQVGDSGAGSLRAAIVSANASPGADRIEFADGVEGTLSLASALPVLEGELVIAGPGADLITVSGGDIVRVFEIAAGATVDIEQLTIAHGSALSGGGISNQGTLNLSQCALIENSAPNGLGGGIDNFGGSLNVVDCRIAGNSADTGGGIANDGTLVIVETSIVGNASVLGGGIDNAGTAVVMDSTLSGNVADFGGGIGNTGTLELFNSTVSGNAATENGGGIENFGGLATLEFSTFTENSAALGGGAWNDNRIDVKNSLIAGNQLSDCFDDGGSTVASGNNIDFDGSCAGFATASAPALALGSLAENGGPTQTHLPGAASIAIDAALDCTRLDGVTAVLMDQRGFERPAGSGCDVGSVEAALNDVVFSDGFE